MSHREQLAWAAGVLDGEGCFSISRSTHGRLSNGERRQYASAYPVVVVGQCGEGGAVPEILLRMSALFGGRPRGPMMLRGRPRKWDWRLHGFELVQFVVAQVWPWLGPVKRRQAKAILTEAKAYYAVRRERQKRCRNGHEYTPQNTAYDGKGVRRCLTCRRRVWVDWHAKHGRLKAV